MLCKINENFMNRKKKKKKSAMNFEHSHSVSREKWYQQFKNLAQIHGSLCK